MPSSRKNIKAMKDIIVAIDDLLATDDWDQSLFLEKTALKFKKLRSEAQEILDDFEDVSTPEQTALAERNLEEAAVGSLQVYVCVFQMDPNNLLAWQTTLRSLTEYSITRPIYKEESHAQEFIRSRPDPSREGYVEVKVQSKDLLTRSGAGPKADTFGHELLSVREGTILPGNIVRFVHADKIYHFNNGELQDVQQRQ